MRSPVLRPAGAAISGLLLNLAFPPHGLWWLTPISVGLLTACVRGRRARQGAWLGFLHGLGFFLPLLVWTSAVAGSGAWLALVVLQSGFLAMLGAGLALVTRLRSWPLWSAAAWVLEEALRGRLPFGGLPWGRLAFSQGASVFTPSAALGGATLVTFLVALVGSTLITRPRPLTVFGPLLLIAAALVPTPLAEAQVTVAVIQGNVPRLGLPQAEQESQVLANHVRATRELAAKVAAGQIARPDLVIWPENASDVDPYTSTTAAAAIASAARSIGVPILVGAVTDGPGRFVSNRGIVWDPSSGPGDSYVKRHPVPFGEYIPLRSLVSKLNSNVDLVPRDFIKGDKVGVLQVGPARLGDVICFEVAYDGLVRDVVNAGAQMIVVQTNNATFGRSGETTQQLAMGRLRAVEHARSVIVAATSGVSAVIAPDGRIRHQSKIFTRDIAALDVPLINGRTVATRLGIWPEAGLCTLALAGLCAGQRRGRKRLSSASNLGGK